MKLCPVFARATDSGSDPTAPDKASSSLSFFRKRCVSCLLACWSRKTCSPPPALRSPLCTVLLVSLMSPRLGVPRGSSQRCSGFGLLQASRSGSAGCPGSSRVRSRHGWTHPPRHFVVVVHCGLVVWHADRPGLDRAEVVGVVVGQGLQRWRSLPSFCVVLGFGHVLLFPRMTNAFLRSGSRTRRWAGVGSCRGSR